MEINVQNKQKNALLRVSENHPNFQLWNNYEQFGAQRGWLIQRLLKNETDLPDKRILDLGCGTGEISEYLLAEAKIVVSIDIDCQRLQKFQQRAVSRKINPVRMSATALGFQAEFFDIIILQDVLEHIHQPAQAIAEVARLLKPGGIFYLVTPNRWSLINLLSDPHWNLPLVAPGNKKWVTWLVKDFFRRENLKRGDFAILLSWFKLRRLLKKHKLEFKFVNRSATKALFENPPAVVCHPFHLKIVNWLKKLKLQKILIKIVNEKSGVFNMLINPTWYIIGRKL